MSDNFDVLLKQIFSISRPSKSVSVRGRAGGELVRLTQSVSRTPSERGPPVSQSDETESQSVLSPPHWGDTSEMDLMSSANNPSSLSLNLLKCQALSWFTPRKICCVEDSKILMLLSRDILTICKYIINIYTGRPQYTGDSKSPQLALCGRWTVHVQGWKWSNCHYHPPPSPPTSSWDSWETDIRLGDGCNSPWLERRLRGNKQDYLSQQMKKWLLLFDLDPKRNNIFTTNETVNCYLCLSCTEIVKSMEKLGRQADKKGVLSFGRLLARFLYIISSHLHKISRIITTGSALLFDELHFL